MKLKQRLILHIGLHKTGTTSLQVACSQSRSLLREAGVEYPDLPEFTGGSVQHVLLTPMLRQPGGCDIMVERLSALCQASPIHTLLLSAEDLSTFFTEPQDRANARLLLGRLDQTFQEWHAYAVVREGPSMTKSLLLQIIESEGFPQSLSQTVRALHEYQRFQCRELKSLLGSRLSGIDYTLLDQAAFCRSLLHRLTGADIALPEVKTNTSRNKSLPLLMSAGIRRLWAESLQEHPFSGNVALNLERTLLAINMEPDEEQRVLDALAQAIDRVSHSDATSDGTEERLIDLINREKSTGSPPGEFV